MFNDLGDRLSRVETGYNGPQVSADAAQGTATQASTQANLAFAQATIALQEAQAAYAYGVQSLQISAQTIVNASNQLTAINTNGITVYSGASATSGARVIMNASGIAGFNTYGVTTFAIDATNGNVSTTGAVFTQSTISGGSLNINGNAVIDSSGFLTASGATIQGTITASAITGSLIRTATSGTRVEIPAGSEIINFYAGSESSSEAGSVYAFSTTISGYSASETIVTAPDPAFYGSTQPGTLATYNASDASSGVIMNGTKNYVNTGTFKIYQNFTGLTGSGTGSYVRNAYIRPTSDGNPSSGGINGDLWFQY
jgi:hypothetical protein